MHHTTWRWKFYTHFYIFRHNLLVFVLLVPGWLNNGWTGTLHYFELIVQKYIALKLTILAVGFPNPWPAFVSTLINNGFVCKETSWGQYRPSKEWIVFFLINQDRWKKKLKDYVSKCYSQKERQYELSPLTYPFCCFNLIQHFCPAIGNILLQIEISTLFKSTIGSLWLTQNWTLPSKVLCWQLVINSNLKRK